MSLIKALFFIFHTLQLLLSKENKEEEGGGGGGKKFLFILFVRLIAWCNHLTIDGKEEIT